MCNKVYGSYKAKCSFLEVVNWLDCVLFHSPTFSDLVYRIFLTAGKVRREDHRDQNFFIIVLYRNEKM